MKSPGRNIQVFSGGTYTKVIEVLGAERLKRVLIAGEADKTVNYENAMKHLGITCETSLHVPSTLSYDGLIMPGGGDIDPKLFGQLPEGTRFFDPALDRLQLAILDAFIMDKKPVLGICKGMQLINIYFGGDIIQHLKTSQGHEYLQKDQLHESIAKKGSLLEKLYGKRFVVNSAHHQGVDSPGRGIEYVQFAKDGVVEGFNHKYLPVFGVQWHPERLCFAHERKDAVNGAALLGYFAGLLC